MTEFGGLGLPDALVDTVARLGYETPTPIQASAIPAMLSGRDIVGLAQTGTGKTAAFALPIIARIDPSQPRTQALVIAPTRELALQVCEAFAAFAAAEPDLRVLPIYGGQNYTFQLSGLRKGAHVVVGTPGRIIDHLERGSLDLSSLETLVLDEADEMLQMGFAEDVDRILVDTPAYKQVALFSATMPSSIRSIAKRHLKDPLDISTPQAKRTTDTIRQRWISVSPHGKLEALTRVLETEAGDASIVFVKTKQATEEIAERLRARGISASALNGDLVQAQRERTVAALKSGSIDVIVATDVAARGLDVDRISHVINYDIPHDTEAYVHRIGRTGRAGREGDAIVFITPRQRRMLSAIEKVSGQAIEQMPVPSFEDVNRQRAQRLSAQITAALGSPQLDAFRELVSEYATQHEVDLLEVAAGLAVVSQDDDFFLGPDPIEEPRERRPRSEAGERTREPRRGSEEGYTAYRLAVGKRHKITPSMVVGALANEGGLNRSDFGKITIGAAHTIVELAIDLDDGALEALSSTRISGKLIEIERDRGRPGGQPRRRGNPHPHSKGKHQPGANKARGSARSGTSDKPRKPRKPRA